MKIDRIICEIEGKRYELVKGYRCLDCELFGKCDTTIRTKPTFKSPASVVNVPCYSLMRIYKEVK